MLKKLFVIAVLMSCSVAYAAEPKDDYDNFNSDGQDYDKFNSTAEDPYRDWNSVLILLQKKGVNTNDIEWSEIDSSCMIVKNTSSEFEFNKCKYNNALNYSQYKKDKTYCDAEAEQKYYQLLKSGKTTVNPMKTEADIKKYKTSAAIVCMDRIGWIDPTSWRSGKGRPGRRY